MTCETIKMEITSKPDYVGIIRLTTSGIANKVGFSMDHKLADEQVLDMKINLSNLDYIDSTGLGVMIGVLKKIKSEEKEIYIINTKSNVKKIFTITGLDKIFKVEG